MQRKWIAILGCLVALLLAGGLAGSVGADAPQQDVDEFPRAEAGLDQTVERNASVLLDGSQSFSPEGQLVDYDWEITTPSGNATAPDCDSTDCSLANFRVPELGQYNVTLTVTDDDGRQRSDTLYVTVVPEGDFGVELTGPGTTGQNGTLSATIAPGEVRVQNVTWYRGGQPIGNQGAPALGGTVNKTAYIVPGGSYRVVVNGSWNRSVSDTWIAPGGGSWTSSGTGNYPRIEGPAVVTGDPDDTFEGHWVYSSTNYILRTNQFGSVNESIWSVDHSPIGEDNFEDGSRVRPDLTPGMNVVVADTEITRDQFNSNRDHHPIDNTIAVSLNNTEIHTIVRRRVIVDPAPQIEIFDATGVGDSVGVHYEGEDRYNPPENIQIAVGGITVYSSSSGEDEFASRTNIEVPSNIFGTTVVQLRVVDGRGQVTTARDTISLPEREVQLDNVPDVTRESAEVGGDPNQMVPTKNNNIYIIS